ncbi:MAG: hypothetical protein EZS28_012632 [Streblomastix strix]|uniref:Uncharacterized protein n=1 Tax=Streblomastix strix TaxID=222440 RepID=A0A5J4WBU2_9EUKA|nr:MAG: hypothetical protein EZS28_012632 [Streblomastix strix]
MQSKQNVNGIVRVIIRFTDSDTKNKQEKHIEQSDSEQTPSLIDMVSCLESLLRQIQINNSHKQVIQIPKVLQSLITLVTFRLGTHLREQTDLLRLQVRRQNQSELVNVGFGRMMIITFCTAGGAGEEKDEEIYNGLYHIFCFLKELYEGRNDVWLPSFQPLPLLARVSLEQIEEEGAIEEIEEQMKNNGFDGYIKGQAKMSKLRH